MNPRSYVTAFAGRRDAYQVPLALAEAGWLERLVTNFYLTQPAARWIERLLGRVPETLKSRQAESSILDEYVTSLLVPELREQLGRRFKRNPGVYWTRNDRRIAECAAAQAKRTRSDLLMYETSAAYTFRARYPDHTPRKVLFQFHTHPLLETEIFSADMKRFPPPTSWLEPSLLSEGEPGAARNAWRSADLILCASSFTKRTLCHAGAEESICRVIPYGVDCPTTIPESVSDGRFQALFVGSGSYRKGLHHLLMAWAKATLPAEALLTIVCRVIDPQLEPLIAATPQVRFIRGVGGAELKELYRNSTLFVMPSLSEGFGQVFLESLAMGCPVLGTPNTCVPDLGGERDGIFVVEPGNVEALAARLEALARVLPGDRAIRTAAWKRAGRYDWPRFRAELLKALG